MGVSRHLRNIREGVRDATAAIRKGLVSEEESACKEESGMEESSPPTPVDLSSCELQSRSVEVALECVGGSGTGNFRCVSQDGDWWVHGGTKGHLVLALSERPTLWIWSSNKQARPKLCAASYFLGSMAPPVGSDQWSPAAALTAIQYFASWQGQQDDDGCYFSIDFNDVPAPKAGSLFLLLHLSGNHGASYIAVNRIKAFGSRRVISCLPQPPVMADVHHVVGNDDMELAKHGAPGQLAVVGLDVAHVFGPEGPMVIGREGLGRFAAFGHESYLKRYPVRLYQQLLPWLTNGAASVRAVLIGGVTAGDLASLRLNVVGRYERPTEDAMLKAVACKPNLIIYGGGGGMSKAEIACAGDPRAASLVQYVRQGGALLHAVCPWGWAQLAKVSIHASLHNAVLGPCGAVYTDGMCSGGPYKVQAHATSLVTSLQSLDMCLVHGVGLEESLSRALLKAVEAYGNPCVPKSEMVDRLLATPPSTPLFPVYPEKVVASGCPTELLNTVRQVLTIKEVQRKMHGAQPFTAPDLEYCGAPGVPQSLDVEPLKVLLKPSSQLRGWQSTGVFLPAGKVSRLTPAQSARGRAQVRIGCHQDGLSLFNSDNVLRRYPQVVKCQQIPLTESTDVWSPFGGLLYFDNVEGGGVLTVTGIRVPWFAPYNESPLAIKDSAMMSEVCKTTHSPFAEFEGRGIIFSFPTPSVKGIQWQKVVEYWDAIRLAECKLSHRNDSQRDRVVADAQISAGWMHSGYPIMTHMSEASSQDGKVPRVLDVEDLMLRGSWGHFHEIGHNCQKPEWTFSGTTEITVNIMTLYAMQEVVGLPPWKTDYMRGNMCKAVRYLEDANRSFRGGWFNLPVGLCSYAVLAHTMGWDFMERVMAAYDNKKLSALITTDDHKIEFWIITCSNVAERDLRNYFCEQWRMPLSEPAWCKYGPQGAPALEIDALAVLRSWCAMA